MHIGKPHATKMSSLALLVCVTFTACVRPTAVDDLARTVARAEQLAPGVLDIGYDVCVASATDTAIASVQRFDVSFRPDQNAIERSCKTKKETAERLSKTFHVIASYVQTLDKLASGGAATYDKNLKSLTSELPGATSAQQGAIRGLVTLIADAVEKHWRERKTAEAIAMAQPHMLVLTKMFDEQIPPFLSAMLDNEQASVGSLYRDIATARAGAPQLSPALVTSLYLDRLNAIERSRVGLQCFQKVVHDIQTAHTRLFENRNKLDRADLIQELFQTASDVQTQVEAMQKAFR